MEFDGARADFRLFAATGLWCPAPGPAQPRLVLVGAVGAELVRSSSCIAGSRERLAGESYELRVAAATANEVQATCG